ncbi:hypothetical protein D3C73_1564870 [compost metagenome]
MKKKVLFIVYRKIIRANISSVMMIVMRKHIKTGIFIFIVKSVSRLLVGQILIFLHLIMIQFELMRYGFLPKESVKTV